MAPGYQSPFDHAPSPNPIHNADIVPPALAIFFCVTIIVCLALFVFCTATRPIQHRDDASMPAQEMALDQPCITKNLAVHLGEDVQRAVSIRDESRIDDVQQPLLLAGTWSNSPANHVEMATRRHDDVYKSAIHWHGINMLNTSWGWMA